MMNLPRSSRLAFLLAFLLSIVGISCRDSVSPPARKAYDWQPVGFQGRLVIRFKESGNVVFVCAGGQGIWKRPRTGQTWEYVGLADTSIDPLALQGVIDLSVHPLDTNSIVALVRPNTFSKHGVFKSSDGGSSWNPSDSGLAYTVGSTRAYHRFDRLLGYSDTLYGLSSDVYRSRDFGSIWAFSSNIGSMPGNIYCLSATGIDLEDIWIGGEDFFFGPILAHSTDRAKTWQFIDLRPFFPGDNAVYGVLVEPLDENTIYAGLPGKLIKSTDRGQTWGVIATELNGNVFGSILTDPAIPGNMWAAAGQLLIHSNDSGMNWDTIKTDFLGSAAIYDMHYEATRFKLMAGTSNGIWEAFVK